MSDAAMAEVHAVREEIGAAVDALFDAIDTLRADLGVAASEAVQAQLARMIEALSFQDITGQRLTKIEELIVADPAPPDEGGAMSLENGPALRGEGLSQTDADAILSAGASPPA